MARTDPTIYMRLAPELKERLEKAALENRRSIAAEVSSRLQRTFEEDANPPGVPSPLVVVQREIIQLTRRKDLLSLQIASLQSRVLQVVERIRTAMVDDSTTDDLQSLYLQRGDLYYQLDKLQVEMAETVTQLEAAYQRAEAHEPQRLGELEQAGGGQAAEPAAPVKKSPFASLSRGKKMGG